MRRYGTGSAAGPLNVEALTELPLWLWALLAAAAIAVLWLWRLAGRIDRLHRRVLAARTRLNRHLVKRSAQAIQISELPIVSDDDGNALRFAATEALLASECPLAADGLDRSAAASDAEAVRRRLQAEDRLTRELERVLTPELRAEAAPETLWEAQLEACDQESYKVELTCSLHNQDVAQVRALRSRAAPKIFRLAGAAPLPAPVELGSR